MADETHFDAVVVGSGFGGSVSAYRLSEAGRRVCVLERGKAYPPTSFPRRPTEMAKNFWDPSRGYHGMFNLWSFRGIEAMVSSGLGGGSLIYANVLLRKDEKWFVQEDPFEGGYEEWPVSRADLDPHYDQVERMLNGQRYPLEHPGYRDTAKTWAMKEAAGRLGLKWELPKLAVTFANPGAAPVIGEPIVEAEYPNLHGRTRTTCRLCGECDIGCNYGSKNTLDHNYLSAAKHHGADIRTRCEVRRFERRADGRYSVSYVEHHPDREGQKTNTAKLPHTTITADRLIIAAGAVGTPYLLLRNRSAFPNLSPALGTRFAGNGDLLGFLLPKRRSRHLPGPRTFDASRGPVITSFMRGDDERDGGDGPGFYIEDGGFPIAIDWMLEALTVPSKPNRFVRFALRRLWARLTRNPKSDLSAELALLVGSGALSSGSLPMLGMGRDIPDGVMKLRNGYLDVDWTTATSKRYFAKVGGTMAAIGKELGADFRQNPLGYLNRVITVHPLGGCPMGRSVEEGVVDGYGEVFNYPGMYVADGSVMPGPVGANPCLTIAAFADRMVDRMLGVSGKPGGNGRTTVATEPIPAAAAVTSVRFTEEMKGYVTLGEGDHEAGYREGKRNGTFLMFHLTIETHDNDRFLTDVNHQATAEGWVECEALGGRLPVERGIFNLYVEMSDRSRTRMLYRLFFQDSVGNPLTLSGFKDIKDDPGFDLWSDTTTLYTRLLRGHVEAGAEEQAEVSASGILHIYMLDFARQLTTFRARGPSFGERSRALREFGQLFLGRLWELYAPKAEEAALGQGTGDGH